MASSADERRAAILEQIGSDQMVSVTELSQRFEVSEVSIRRDLDRLAQHGLLKRIHGGAVSISDAALDQSYHAKIQRRIEEKECIGRAAAKLIRPSDQLIFDASTTAFQVARNISGDLLSSGNLTIITASLPIVVELGHWKGVHVILLGGVYLPEYKSFVGPQALSNLQGLYPDKAFIGTDGLTLSRGATGSNILEAEVDRAMAQSASEVILVADSSKIGQAGLTSIAPIEQIDRFVTDEGAPADFVKALSEQGTDVILAC
jgi:DeoR/GlpR family transcriptional regulator of sugar metabolism